MPRQRALSLGLILCLLLAACGARFKTGTQLTAGGSASGGGGSVSGVDSGAGTTSGGTSAGTAAGVDTSGGGSSGTSLGGTGGTGSGAAAVSGGSGTSGGGGSGTAADIGSTQGVTANQIKIGVLIPITGAAPVPTSIKESITVAYEWINKNGGIDGRMLTPIIYDTTSTSTGAQAAAQKAIEDDKVFLIVILDRIDIQEAVAAYLQTRNFPNIEIQMTPHPPSNQDWAFGLTIDQGDQGKLIADYLVKVMGLKKLGVATEQQTQLAAGRNEFVAEAKALGAAVVYNDQIDGQANDYSQNTLKAQQSGAQAVWLYVAPTPALKFVNQAQAIGYHPTWFADAISWAFNLTLTSGGAAALQGAKAFSEWPTLDDPRTATYKQAYAYHDQKDGSTTQPDDLGIPAWGFTEILAGALRAAGRNLGQLAIKRVLTNFSYSDPDRMWAPVHWSPGVRVGTNQVDVYRVGSINGQPAWQLERDYTSGF